MFTEDFVKRTKHVNRCHAVERVACLSDRKSEGNSHFLVVDNNNGAILCGLGFFLLTLVFLQIKNNTISTIRSLNIFKTSVFL